MIPDITNETKWFKSPYVGHVNLSVLKQISYKASLSIANIKSANSNKSFIAKHELYGSTTTSETNGDGITENVAIIYSEKSVWISLQSKQPKPEPVPPPNEWII